MKTFCPKKASQLLLFLSTRLLAAEPDGLPKAFIHCDMFLIASGDVQLIQHHSCVSHCDVLVKALINVKCFKQLSMENKSNEHDLECHRELSDSKYVLFSS